MHNVKFLPDQVIQCFKQTRGVMAAGALLALASQSASAACTYKVDNEWNTGFVASITIKNDTGAAINNWSVNWAYSNNHVTSAWNASLSGTNPYTATNIGWNGNIAPGQSVTFGFQGNKNNSAAAERPTVTGAACNGGVASSINSSAPSSSVSSNSSSSLSSSLASTSVSSLASSSQRSSSSSSVISTQAQLVVAINAGGAQVNYNGAQYQADQYSTGGTAHSTKSP